MKVSKTADDTVQSEALPVPSVVEASNTIIGE